MFDICKVTKSTKHNFNFPWLSMIDSSILYFPGLENEILKFHDFSSWSVQTPFIQWEEEVGSLSYGYLPNVRKAFCRSPSISLSIDSAISFLVNWQTAREQELLCAKRRALACTRNAEKLISNWLHLPPSKFPHSLREFKVVLSLKLTALYSGNVAASCGLLLWVNMRMNLPSSVPQLATPA